MKKLIIIFFTSTLFGCDSASIDDPRKRNENWAWFVNSGTGEGEWGPLIDGNTSFKTGDITYFYFNGNIQEKAKLFNGKYIDTAIVYSLKNSTPIKYKITINDTMTDFYLNDGNYIEHFNTGEVFEKTVVVNNKRSGNWIRYYKNGNKMWVSNQEESGWSYWYFENGVKQNETYHINGVANGRARNWDKNGNLYNYVDMVNGEYHGITEHFYPNGITKSIEEYVHGKRHGVMKAWYENGQLKVSGHRKNELPDGEIIWYNSDGTVSKKGFYENGKLVSEKKQ